MRQSYLYLLLMIYLAGCTMSDAQGIAQQHRIPLDSRRWYTLSNPALDPGRLTDGVAQDKITPANRPILEHYDIIYPVLAGEHITVDSMALFDWEGTNEDAPVTIYALVAGGRRVTIGTFTGSAYNRWVGPDPRQPDKLALAAPVPEVQAIILNTHGALPGELVLYGQYTTTMTPAAVQEQPQPLKNFMGVNAFEWDFEAPERPMELDPARLAAIANFKAVRHYMDWEKLEGVQGAYAFAPTYNGSWNYDAMYQWCHDNSIEVLPCFKTIPGWMQETWPASERDNENTPMAGGRDPLLPASYLEQAQAAYQFAARYGGNTHADRMNVKLKGDNRLRTGMGVIHYLECDNERNKWWKGRKAYQTPWEYAANLSAFYDGHKGALGPRAGVKAADTGMKVVMGGLATPDARYLQGMIDWSRQNRGYRADGAVNVPWDVINYHFYAGAAGGNQYAEQTGGMCPEKARADSFAANMVRLANEQLAGMPVWITETGYDLHEGSPQCVARVPGRKAEEVQADWIVRTSLLYARSGIGKLFYYQLYDDAPGSATRYATSGLVNKDRTPRLAATYLRQLATLMGDYTYKQTISRMPVVDKYTYNDKVMYALVVPDEKGRTMPYTLDLGTDSAVIYTPAAGRPDMMAVRRKTTNGKLVIKVTETPVFITGINSRSNLVKQ